MTKSVLVICKECNDIPINRECYCGLIGTTISDYIIRIFSDNIENFEFCIGFLNDRNEIKEITRLPESAIGSIELHPKDIQCLINQMEI